MMKRILAFRSPVDQQRELTLAAAPEPTQRPTLGRTEPREQRQSQAGRTLSLYGQLTKSVTVSPNCTREDQLKFVGDKSRKWAQTNTGKGFLVRGTKGLGTVRQRRLFVGGLKTDLAWLTRVRTNDGWDRVAIA